MKYFRTRIFKNSGNRSNKKESSLYLFPTKRVIYYTLLIVLFMSFSNCIETLMVSQAPDPVAGIRQSSVQDPPNLDQSEIQLIDEMVRHLKVRFANGVPQKDYSEEIRRCLQFLLVQFGPPLYNGDIFLFITENLADDGKMAWSDRRRSERTIALNKANLLSPTAPQLHILVHELFHAFYQTNDLIKANPDFITEGLAVYAEYKFRYYEWNNEKILKKMRQQSKTLDPALEKRLTDFDRPFSEYNSRDIDLFYILSGQLFFSQNSIKIQDKIRSILTQGTNFENRQSFEYLLSRYDLKITEPFLKNNLVAMMNLPEPMPSTKKTAVLDNKRLIKRFYVQIGSYEGKNKWAIYWAKKIEDMRYPTEWRSKENDEGLLLLVGPFDNIQDAEKAMKALLNVEGMPTNINIEEFEYKKP